MKNLSASINYLNLIYIFMSYILHRRKILTNPSTDTINESVGVDIKSLSINLSP